MAAAFVEESIRPTISIAKLLAESGAIAEVKPRIFSFEHFQAVETLKTAQTKNVVLKTLRQRASALMHGLVQNRIWLHRLLAGAVCGMLLRKLARRSRLIAAAAVVTLAGRARQGQRLHASAAAAIRAGRGNKGEEDRANGERVCVVGAGIAGCSAAWALHRSGFEVTLLENKPVLGGNMKINTWKVEGQEVTTGLAVLAWPAQLFHNYNALIKELGVQVTSHVLRWFITRRLEGRDQNDVECVYAHQPTTAKAKMAMQEPWLLKDLAAWGRCMAFIKRVNLFFCPKDGVDSLYRSSLLNPLNMISLRTLTIFFGVSRRFWDEVFTAIHASSLLETKLETIPAVMAEAMEDIVPIADPNSPPEMDSWASGHGMEVFEGLTAGFRDRVFTSSGADGVRIQVDSTTGKTTAVVIDTNGIEREFDRVIFACGAPATLRCLPAACPMSSLTERARYWALRSVLAGTKYVEDRDLTYERAVVHSDSKQGLPTEFEQEILEDFGTYCETKYCPKGELRYENVFVVSAWQTKMQEPALKGKRPMLISWNCKDRLKDIEDEHYEKDVVMREAHPQLNMMNLMASYFIWQRLQGSCGGTLFFTGSSVTPGNAHDLSLLSGFVVANHMGADYPFPDNAAALSDFHALQKMMGLNA